MDQFHNLNRALEIIIKIIFLFLVGLIFYTIYRSEVLYNGLHRDYYIKYYIFFISSILVLFFINFLNKKIRLQIYAILFSLVMGSYISEILLIDYKSLKNKTKHQYYSDLKQEQDVVMSIFPYKYILKNANQKEIFPLSGISKKLTIYCQKKENQKFITYKSDRYGFRNKDIVWDKKNIDFILLGDSTVQGSCVTEDKTIGSQISQILKRKLNNEINIINLGLNGSGPLLEYAALKEYMQNVKTKKVLYFFTEGNDLINLELELKDPFLKKYLNDEYQQKLANKQSDVDEVNYNLLENEFKKKNRNIYTFIKLERLRLLLGDFLNYKSEKSRHKPSEETYRNYNDILIKLKKLTKSQNAELYFIYMPYVLRYTGYNYDHNYEFHSKIISMVEKLDIKYVDILSKFESGHNDPLSLYQLRKYQHFNETGYKFVAETIIKEIN